MSDNATTTKGKFRIGLGLAWLGTITLAVFGGQQLHGPLDFSNRNAENTVVRWSTGAVLTVNNVTVYFRDNVPLSMSTSSGSQYQLAMVELDDYRIIGTGALTTAGLSWVYAPAGGTSDIGISKCRNGTNTDAYTGSVLVNGNNKTNATGSLVGLFGTGFVLVNGDDCVVATSRTNPTSSGSGYLIIEGFDDPSE